MMATFYRTGKSSLRGACAGLGAILSICLNPVISQAGVSADGHYWVIEKGDSVYSIARRVFPDDADKQRRFRQALVEQNQAVFQGDAGRIKVGDRLSLPAFAVTPPVDTAKPAVVKMKAEAVADVPVDSPVTEDPQEVIGRVVVSVGSMQASNRGGFRGLLRNSKIYKGDTLVTAANSYTQIRMKDGALISLRPNTKLVIREYHFNGQEDGTEKSFMELVRGGFRTITGYIGHKNKRNYRVTTGVATIGVRGTHYGLMVCEAGSCANEAEPLEDGVYGGVVDGSIVVSNDSGSFTFNNDQYFHVVSANAPAVEMLVPPPVFHGRPEKIMGRAKAAEGAGKKVAAGVENGKGRVEKIQARAGEALQKGRSLTAGLKNRKGGSRLGALVASAVENAPRPLVLPDQINDVIKDTPKVQAAPDGSGMLISLYDATPNIIEPGVSAQIAVNKAIPENDILLGTKIAPNGNAAYVPIAARALVTDVLPDGTTRKVGYELALPSATAGVIVQGQIPIGINWGIWDTGYELRANGSPVATQGPMHYIYSDNLTTPTALGGLKGVATYVYAGGTTPSVINANGVSVGAVNVTAAVDFQLGKLTSYNLDVSLLNAPVPSMNLSITGPLSFSAMQDFNLVDANCPSCTGKATAAFVGPQAGGMITSFSATDQRTGMTVQAVGALNRQ